MIRYEQIFKEDINTQTKKQIVDRLQDALTYLGYVSYDDNLKYLNNEAIKLQAQIEKFLKKL